MATYYISGVWRNDAGVITDVLLHQVNPNGSWNMDTKTSMANAVAIKNQQNSIRTIKWNCQAVKWDVKAECIVVHEGGRSFIRSQGSQTVTDNLDNLISMAAIK